MRHPAILFDLDGTLVDSAPAIRAGLRAALTGVGVAVPADPILTACIGLPLPHVWARLGVPEPDHAAAVAAYRAWSAAGGQSEARPYPGAAELLRELYAAGVVLILASAKDTAAAARALDRLGWRSWFHAVSGSEPGDGPDKRALVRRALDALPAGSAAGAAMVGDMPLDGDAAAAAGIPFVAATWGYGDPAALAALSPVAAPADIAALTGWLRG